MFHLEHDRLSSERHETASPLGEKTGLRPRPPLFGLLSVVSFRKQLPSRRVAYGRTCSNIFFFINNNFLNI